MNIPSFFLLNLEALIAASFAIHLCVDELMVFDQSRREAVKQAMVIDTTENEITSRSKAGTLLCAKKQHKKKKRTSFRSNYGKGIHMINFGSFILRARPF
jgi:hypothetical protein